MVHNCRCLANPFCIVYSLPLPPLGNDRICSWLVMADDTELRRCILWGISPDKTRNQVKMEIEKPTGGVNKVIVYRYMHKLNFVTSYFTNLPNTNRNCFFACDNSYPSCPRIFIIEYKNRRLASDARRVFGGIFPLFGKAVDVFWYEEGPIPAEVSS